MGAPRARSAVELKRLIELDRALDAYIVLRDGADEQVELVLDRERALTVGRDDTCDIALTWDATASRLHAELECRAGAWLVLDDGVSKNGTFVNGERVHGRRRLHDGDVLLIGATSVLFRNPKVAQRTGTAAVTGLVTAADVSPTQRKVLVALCRPFAGGSPHAVPATNRQIAEELVLSDEAIKSHMRALFHRFGVEALPQNAKRARLVELALRSGVVAPRDLA